MGRKAKTKTLPSTPSAALSAAATKPSSQGNTDSGGTGDPTSETPAGQDKKVIQTKVLGTVKRFNLRDGYGFITRNDTGEDIFVHHRAIKKNNPRKSFHGVGDGETVEFDIVEGVKGVEAANVTGPGGIAVQGSKYAADRNTRCADQRGPPRHHHQNYQNSQSEEKSEGAETSTEDQASQRWPFPEREFPLSSMQTRYMRQREYSSRPVQGKVMEGAYNQGARREQGKPVRPSAYQAFRPRSRRRPPCQRQPSEDHKEEDKEHQGAFETQGQQPPQGQRGRNFTYRCRHPESRKPQDGKETKAANPPAENPQAEQGGAD